MSVPAQSVSKTETYHLRYDASLLGIPIGRADFTSKLSDGRFTVSGHFASAGIARLFDRTDGAVSATGRLSGARAVPEHYQLKYKSGKKRETTTIRFAGGRVSETRITPKPKKRGKKWIAVQKSQLSGVTDPLSALLSPVKDASQVCKRRFKVFDGEMRADIVLKPAGSQHQGGRDTITCRAQFVPISGYRKNRSTIAFLRDKARILITFKPVGAVGYHTPVEARIGTKIGTVYVKARSL